MAVHGEILCDATHRQHRLSLPQHDLAITSSSLPLLLTFVYIFHARMSHSLRKRIPGLSSTPSDSREESPAKAEEVVLAPKSKVTHHGKTRKRRNGLIFFLGGLFGIVVAGFFAGRSDLIDFPEFGELSMDSIIDVLPAGFVSDARDLAVCVLYPGSLAMDGANFGNREERGKW
jgi:hypothetical protein